MVDDWWLAHAATKPFSKAEERFQFLSQIKADRELNGGVEAHLVIFLSSD